jgi:predicted nicotinamide N-methyase
MTSALAVASDAADFDFNDAVDTLLLTLLDPASHSTVPRAESTITLIQTMLSVCADSALVIKGIVTQAHVNMVHKSSFHWLITLNSAWAKRPPYLNDSVSVTEAETARIEELACEAISSITSIGGSKSISRRWRLRYLPPLDIRERSFIESGFGWQTWGSGVVLSSIISRKQYIDLTGHVVLELGCGTGLAGIAASFSGAQHVTMSDFNDDALSNARFNAAKNGCDVLPSNSVERCASADLTSRPVSFLKLDWRDPELSIQNYRCDTVIAADCCYEQDHGRCKLKKHVCFFLIAYLPYLVVSGMLDHLLTPSLIGARVALLVIALRDKFQPEIDDLEACLRKKNIRIEISADFRRDCDMSYGLDQEDLQSVFNQGPERGFRFYKLLRD